MMRGLYKTPEEWLEVDPDAVVAGSTAQARNVLEMAIKDIGRLDGEIRALRNQMRRMRGNNSRLQKAIDLDRGGR